MKDFCGRSEEWAPPDDPTELCFLQAQIGGPDGGLRLTLPTHNDAIVGPELIKISIGAGNSSVEEESMLLSLINRTIRSK
jgi:hypothetical protein